MKAIDLILWFVFPVTVVAVLGGGVWAIDAGHPPSLVAAIGTFASLALVVILERALPYRKDRNHSQDRWHHSLKISEANHSYGSNFLFWDVVFGTRYRDAEKTGPERLGIENDVIPDRWWSQLWVPFKMRYDP